MPRRGEIYLVNFPPGIGSEQRGLRPAAIVQNDLGNEYSGTTIVAALSSRANPDYPFRVEVAPRDSGLRERTVVLLDQLATVDQERLRDRVGRLSPGAISAVDRALHHSLGLLD